MWLSLGHWPPFFYVTINMIYIMYDKAHKTHYGTKDRARGPSEDSPNLSSFDSRSAMLKSKDKTAASLSDAKGPLL